MEKKEEETYAQTIAKKDTFMCYFHDAIQVEYEEDYQLI